MTMIIQANPRFDILQTRAFIEESLEEQWARFALSAPKVAQAVHDYIVDFPDPPGGSRLFEECGKIRTLRTAMLCFIQQFGQEYFVHLYGIRAGTMIKALYHYHDQLVTHERGLGPDDYPKAPLEMVFLHLTILHTVMRQAGGYSAFSDHLVFLEMIEETGLSRDDQRVVFRMGGVDPAKVFATI